jgi:hypothetical protein
MYKSDKGRACTFILILLHQGFLKNTPHHGEIMPETEPDDDCQKPSSPSDCPDGFTTDLPVNMTLENILDLTGEMEHLNELVMLSLDKVGGFTSAEAYFTTVQPILDLLEVEIRVRYHAGMSKNEMKLIIQDWVDCEIRTLQ